MKALRGLMAVDARMFFRDPLVQFMTVYPLILGLIMRLLVPWLLERLTLFDFAQFFVLIGSIAIAVVVGVFTASVLSLVVLDEKDDGVLVALQVTPLPAAGFLAYRAALVVVLGCLASVLNMILMSNFLALPSWPDMALIALMSGLPTPFYALIITSMSQNKVQGMALIKVVGLFVVVPVAAYFMPEPWQWLMGFAPSYWQAKLYWQVAAGATVWPVVLAGLVCAALWMGVWLRVFRHRTWRGQV